MKVSMMDKGIIMNLQRGQVIVHPEDNLLRVRGREGGREKERESE